MKERKKNARPDVGASERAKETGPDFQTGPHSYSQSTTPPPSGQRISDFLNVGKTYAIPLHDLTAITGRNERDVRKQIETERRRGTPILSNSKDGYWLGENQDEIAQFVRGMKHRARQIQLTADAVGKAAGIGK